MDDTKEHTHDQSAGTTQGVPHGVTLEESKGLPDSSRHETESAPFHNDS